MIRREYADKRRVIFFLIIFDFVVVELHYLHEFNKINALSAAKYRLCAKT